MNDSSNSKIVMLKLLKSVAVVAAIFSLIVGILVIANYFRLRSVSPIKTVAISQLVDKLNENPQDEALRLEIRKLDFFIRKAYFANQWQVRFGGYLLFIGVLVTLLAWRGINQLQRAQPVPQNAESDWLINLAGRKGVGIFAGVFFLIAFVAIFLAQHQLSDTVKDKVAAINQEVEIDKQESKVSTSESTQTSNDTTATQIADTTTANMATAPYPDRKTLLKNFPNFRGIDGNGIVFNKKIPTQWDGKSGKNVCWKLALPKHGFNSPIIWDNKIFLTGADAAERQVYCIDRTTGKLLWKQSTGQIQGSPSKMPEVTEDTGLAAPTMTTDGQRVFAIFASGDIVCFDMEGKRIWARNIGVPENHYGHSSSLMMYRDKVIIQFDQRKGGTIMALSSTTGETVWTKARQVKISWASPVIVNTGKQTEIILNSEPFVAAYNPMNGNELWKIDAVFGEVGPSVAYSDGVVYAANEYARLVAIKLGEKPEIIWESSDYMPDASSPVATDKYLFIATSYGTVACFDAKTGEIYWTHEYGTGFYASPMIAEGKVYLLDRAGNMHIVKADKTFTSIADPKLGEKAVATPAFADGHIYIRGEKNLYCIGK